MPGEEQEQERFEDYLELDRYLEELEAGGTPRLPETMTPGQARVYRMAALFRSASPGANEPRPAFAAELQTRLLQAPRSSESTPTRPVPVSRPQPPRRRGLVSRRLLLAGGSAIAASLMAGAAIDHTVEQEAGVDNSAPPPTSWSTPLVPADVSSVWHEVTTLAELGDQVLPFTANGIVGYVFRANSTNNASSASPSQWKGAAQEEVIALSAACTHMGCIVKWQGSDHQFHCPCHGGLFNAAGEAAAGASSKLYLRPLPRLDTKIDNGKVLVRVPAKP